MKPIKAIKKVLTFSKFREKLGLKKPDAPTPAPKKKLPAFQQRHADAQDHGDFDHHV